MFILEVFIYAFFAFVMNRFGVMSNRYALHGSSLKRLDGGAWLWIGFYVLICAIRWNVGTDCNSYIHIFEKGIISENRSNEYIWSLLVSFVYRLGLHSSVGLGIAAFLQIFFIIKAVKDYRYLLITIPIVLFGGNYYLEMQNAVRQMIVACMFLYASRWIVDKRPVPYVVLLYFASFIHHSALMLIPLYMLRYVPFITKGLAEKRTLCLSIFIVCFLLGNTPQFSGMVSFISGFIQQFGYKEYEEHFIDLATGQTENEDRSFGPIQLSFFLTALSLIWFGPRLFKEYGSKIKYFNLWYILGFAYGCLYFLFCNVEFMFLRPLMHFELFQMIIISLLIYDFYVHKKNTQSSRNLPLLVIVLWITIVWGIMKGMNNSYESTTYKTFITKGQLLK